MINYSRNIQQASWRTRRQRLGTILIVIVGVVMVAGLYLDVAARTTLVGREIQSLERDISATKAENANLKTELARLLSYHEISSRSDALGFRRATAAETHYIVVPGYTGKAPIDLVIADDVDVQNDLLAEAYTQSLFDWLGVQITGGTKR